MRCFSPSSILLYIFLWIFWSAQVMRIIFVLVRLSSFCNTVHSFPRFGVLLDNDDHRTLWEPVPLLDHGRFCKMCSLMFQRPIEKRGISREGAQMQQWLWMVEEMPEHQNIWFWEQKLSHYYTDFLCRFHIFSANTIGQSETNGQI